MATIQDYLELIKNAIYGKDVRQAIHDGIQQCYYDGKAGSTDLEARQRLDSAEGSITSLDSRISTAEGDIDTLDARVDQIVAPSGEAPSAAEVSDARVGANGTTYTSLGDAIRGQVSDLKSDSDLLVGATTSVDTGYMYNGSVGSEGNAKCVATCLNQYKGTIIEKYNVSGYNSVSVYTDRDLPSGHEYRVQYVLFDSSKNKISESNYDSKYYNQPITIPDGISYVGFTFSEYDSSGNQQTLRLTDFTGKYVHFIKDSKHGSKRLLLEHITEADEKFTELETSFSSVLTSIDEAIHDGGKNYLLGADWSLGGLYNGNVYPYPEYEYYPYRVVEKAQLIYTYPLTIRVASGYRFAVATYSGGSYTDSGWKTGDYTIPANTKFRLLIAQNPDGSSADVDTFVGALTFSSVLQDVVNPNIVARNKDVECAMFASSYYGIHSAGQQNAKKKLSMLVLTDVHGGIEATDNMIEYLNAYDALDAGVCLGDMTPQYYNDSNGQWYTSAVNDANKPFYTILGNHDGGNGKTASQNATVAQSFNKWIAPTLSKIGLPSLTVPYYRIDNSTYKVSMIFLNNYDVSDTTDGSGNYVVSRGAEVISQTQIDWLLNELNDIPSDYTLVVLMHSFPYANTPYECAFTQSGIGLVGNTAACYTNIVPEIINAWKNGSTLSKTYDPQISDVVVSVTVDADFTSRGTGQFACYLVGHTHADVIAHSTTYPDQLICGFVSSATDSWQNGDNDLPRVKNTKSFDAITVVSIDTATKSVRLVRVGSNKTILMADRTMISLQYD